MYNTNLLLMPEIFNSLSEQDKQQLLFNILAQVGYEAAVKTSPKAGLKYWNTILQDNPEFARWYKKEILPKMPDTDSIFSTYIPTVPEYNMLVSCGIDILDK